MRKPSSSSVRIFYPKFEREELIQKLENKIEDLARKLPLSLVILFGSYAQGNYTVASDVDLLIVYSGNERKDAFATVKKTLEIPLLEPHVHSEEQYNRLRTIIGPMIADGVILFSRKGAKTTKQNETNQINERDEIKKAVKAEAEAKD